MGRPPCCDKSSVRKGPWTPEEDAKILAYISGHGTGNWTAVPKKAGYRSSSWLKRCGKSCRLRWTNYLRPDLKHDRFTPQEEDLIVSLHAAIGSRWSLIAAHLPGRTDNDIKNYWNTKLRKKLREMGIDPVTHRPISQILADYGNMGLTNPLKYHGRRHHHYRHTSLNPELENKLTPNLGELHHFNQNTNNLPSTQEAAALPNNYNNHPWDLLAQIHAIKFASEASNCSSETPVIAENANPVTKISNEAATETSQQVQDYPESSSSNSGFTWSEFLLDDELYASQPNGDTELTPLLFEKEMKEEKDVLGPLHPIQMVDGVVGSPSISTSGRACDDSFVHGLLEGDRQSLLWEFPELFDNPLPWCNQ
ncbi:hypothetical protein AMTRI_Chr03g46670 [Amborella trichopoda]